ncbi:hypothetical protein DPV78_000551 [Talaromyces pinophilus]|nr:hypothetical protein DPV78_000551 [Talaromyces pinophilus]
MRGSREAGRNGRCRSGLEGGGGISVGPGTAPPVSESPQKWLLAINRHITNLHAVGSSVVVPVAVAIPVPVLIAVAVVATAAVAAIPFVVLSAAVAVAVGGGGDDDSSKCNIKMDVLLTQNDC